MDSLAEIEITSDDPEHPIDSALIEGSDGDGWRASTPGEQMIRICFLKPQPLKRIRLVFEEKEEGRTQEFVLRWLREGVGDDYREIVRQQYNFSPPGTARETEDYQVDLHQARILELIIVPEIGGSEAYASLKELRLG